VTRAPGDVVHLAHLGEVTLVREMNGQSSIDGWEVRRSDGRLAYVTDDDFDLTDEDVKAIRAILKGQRPSLSNSPMQGEKP
jgi:hypothetical protein